jgi:hypothetical protein
MPRTCTVGAEEHRDGLFRAKVRGIRASIFLRDPTAANDRGLAFDGSEV